MSFSACFALSVQRAAFHVGRLSSMADLKMVIEGVHFQKAALSFLDGLAEQ